MTLFALLGNAPVFDKNLFRNTAPIYSSFGDLTRLNILESYRPGCRAGKDETIEVRDMWFSLRLRSKSYANFIMQYDGQLQVMLCVGGRYSSKREVEMYEEVTREWLACLM